MAGGNGKPKRERCVNCGGSIVDGGDYRGGRWWRETHCLMCGRPAESAPVSERSPEAQLRELPRDMRGWRQLMERPEA